MVTETNKMDRSFSARKAPSRMKNFASAPADRRIAVQKTPFKLHARFAKGPSETGGFQYPRHRVALPAWFLHDKEFVPSHAEPLRVEKEIFEEDEEVKDRIDEDVLIEENVEEAREDESEQQQEGVEAGVQEGVEGGEDGRALAEQEVVEDEVAEDEVVEDEVVEEVVEDEVVEEEVVEDEVVEEEVVEEEVVEEEVVEEEVVEEEGVEEELVVEEVDGAATEGDEVVKEQESVQGVAVEEDVVKDADEEVVSPQKEWVGEIANIGEEKRVTDDEPAKKQEEEEEEEEEEHSQKYLPVQKQENTRERRAMSQMKVSEEEGTVGPEVEMSGQKDIKPVLSLTNKRPLPSLSRKHAHKRSVSSPSSPPSSPLSLLSVEIKASIQPFRFRGCPQVLAVSLLLLTALLLRLLFQFGSDLGAEVDLQGQFARFFKLVLLFVVIAICVNFLEDHKEMQQKESAAALRQKLSSKSAKSGKKKIMA